MTGKDGPPNFPDYKTTSKSIEPPALVLADTHFFGRLKKVNLGSEQCKTLSPTSPHRRAP